MNLYSAFIDELEKLADDSQSEADVAQQEFTPPMPDAPAVPEPTQAEENTAPGQFADSETRHTFQNMLASLDGRKEVRDAYTSLRSKIDGLLGERKAFTRSLLRARREIFGPSSAPRADLRRLLYREEPMAETVSA